MHKSVILVGSLITEQGLMMPPVCLWVSMSASNLHLEYRPRLISPGGPVDQLWLWVLGNDTLLTFAAPKESGDDRGGAYLQADIRQRIYNDVHGFVIRQLLNSFSYI